MRRQRLGMIAAAAMLGASAVGGCSSTGCASGADDAPGAVRGFLDAAVSARTEDDVCRWVPAPDSGEGLELAQTLAPALAEVPVESLIIEEAKSEQEGSVHVVKVAGGDLTIRSFLVLDEEGDFVVAAGATLSTAADAE